jgi:phosphoglycolate phosphatase-like HAD superfamily hydrolase
MWLIARIVLFDIDGTLISSSAAGEDERRRYLKTIRDVVGIEPSVIPSRFAGMVDPQICRILLAETGLDDEKVEYFLPKVLTRMGEIYRGMEKRPILNEGVEKLLRILTKSQNHIVGVLTGNLSAVATEKLRVTGIDSYFAEHFYADNYFDRNRLIEDAVRTCVANYKLSDRKSMMIVGDTPRDVSAANAAKATSIGIASGIFSLEQLSQAHATWVFSDLKPSKELLRALGLGPQP